MNQTECTENTPAAKPSGYKQTDDTTRAIIVHESIKNGTSQVDIAKKVGVSKSVVKRVLKSYRETGSHKASTRSGRPPKLNKRDKRQIIHDITRDPTEPLTKICKNLATPVSDKTLRKFLRGAGIHSRKTISKPKSSKVNQKK